MNVCAYVGVWFCERDRSPHPPDAGVSVVYVCAEGKDEAENKIREKCLATFPVADGWRDHICIARPLMPNYSGDLQGSLHRLFLGNEIGMRSRLFVAGLFAFNFHHFAWDARLAIVSGYTLEEMEREVYAICQEHYSPDKGYQGCHVQYTEVNFAEFPEAARQVYEAIVLPGGCAV